MTKLLFNSALLSVIFLGSIEGSAQDPFFTQQNYGLSFINPAYTGASACARAEVGHRIQWPALGANFQTTSAAYEQCFAFGGLGLTYSHDVAGDYIKTDRFDFNYAYGFKIGEDADGKAKLVVQPGVQVSYFRKFVDWGSLTFGNQIDPRRGFVYNTSGTPATGARNCLDISAGLLAYTKRLLFGFSTFHLNEPNEAILGTSRLPMRFVVHASGIIGNADAEENGISLIPTVTYMRQQNFDMVTGLLTLKYHTFSLGAGYRSQDAALFTAGYTFSNFTIGYSYDHTISKLGKTGGSHELHVVFSFLKDQWSSRRNIQMFL